MTISNGTNFDQARLQNLLKHTYSKNVQKMVPETDQIAEECEFIEKERAPGLLYNQPVTLTREMGATFNLDGSAFRLNKPQSRNNLNAQIQGTEIAVRSLVSYAALHRALKGDTRTEAGMRAFVNATKDTVVALTQGASFFREACLLYGGGAGVSSALAAVETIVSAVGTALTISVNPGDWASALWAGSEGGEYDIFSTGGTKRNSAGSDTDSTSVYKLNAINNGGNYRLSFDSNSTNVSNVAITDQIFFAGQRTKDMLGIVGACQTAGTLWNIATTNNLWKPRTTALGGTQFTFEKLNQGISKIADIGFRGTMNVHVSTNTWQDLMEDQAATVQHADKAGGEVSLGYESIVFYGQTGKVRIKPNIYIKRGIAVGLPEGLMKRVGSTDITFEMPGYGRMVREPDDYAGVEMRCYQDQAIFCEKPAFMHLWTGITNSAD